MDLSVKRSDSGSDVELRLTNREPGLVDQDGVPALWGTLTF